MILSEKSSRGKSGRILMLLYVLALYILFQLCWWGYHLIELNKEILELKSVILGESQLPRMQSKVWMVLGEGGVFIILLSIGFWYVLRTFRREIALARMEKTFLLSVTHELKTPIAAVKLQLETMQSSKLTDEQREKLMTTALKETRRLQDLTENILLATRLDQHNQPLHRELFSLFDVVEHEAERLGQLYKLKISFHADDDGMINGDPQMIAVVVSNLIENAVKYGGGNDISVVLKKDTRHVRLEVADTGPGIEDHEKPKIFERFYRIGNEDTRLSKGTGLGLFICQTIMKLHHGQIGVRNNQPTGSIFELTFPILTT